MKTVTILKADYKGYLFATRILNSLYHNGVRDWEGYDEAFNTACEQHEAADDDQIPGITSKEVG